MPFFKDSVLGPKTTQVKDTLYGPSGQLASGSLAVSASQDFISPDGYPIKLAIVTTVQIVNGVLSVRLVPNLGAVPSSTFYNVTYTLGSATWTEKWIIPQYNNPVELSDVRAQASPLPIFIPTNQLLPPSGVLDGQTILWSVAQQGWLPGSGGAGGVTSVFGRTGTVTAQSNDYTASQVTNAESTLNKNVASGYAGLSVMGLLLSTLFPALTGDVTTPGGSLVTTLKNTGTAGTYTKITTDAQGRVSSGTTLSAGDIPNIAESQVTGLAASLAACEQLVNKDTAGGYAGLDASALLKATEFPAPTATTFGGIKSLAAAATKFLTSIGTNGIPVAAQPLLSDLGSPSGSVTFTMTGDGLTYNWATNSFTMDTSGNATHGLVSYTTAVVSSPTLSIAGSYQNAATPTFAKDSWTAQVVIGSGTNGTSQLQFVHSGTTGQASVQFPASGSGTTLPSIVLGASNQGFLSIGAGTLQANTGTGFAFASTGGTIFGQITTQSIGNHLSLTCQTANNAASVLGRVSNSTTVPMTGFGNLNGTFIATSGLQNAMLYGVGATAGSTASLTFAPTSGTANFNFHNTVGFINQTGGANGTYNGFLLNITETAYGGSAQGSYLLNLQVGGVQKGGIDRTGIFYSQATAGVSAGSFSAITAITTVGGIVTQLTGTSDERLKDAFPYTGGLSNIEQIDPIMYRWNTAGKEHTGIKTDQLFVGFSAQNVQRAIPEAITGIEHSKDGNDYLSFDPRPIIANLVNAVKELSARLKVLESRSFRA